MSQNDHTHRRQALIRRIWLAFWCVRPLAATQRSASSRHDGAGEHIWIFVGGLIGGAINALAFIRQPTRARRHYLLLTLSCLRADLRQRAGAALCKRARLSKRLETTDSWPTFAASAADRREHFGPDTADPRALVLISAGWRCMCWRSAQ
jgi:hypothetical protein